MKYYLLELLTNKQPKFSIGQKIKYFYATTKASGPVEGKIISIYQFHNNESYAYYIENDTTLLANRIVKYKYVEENYLTLL